MSAALSRAVRAVGHFWFDFFIGDTPELLIGVLIVLGLGALLSIVAGWNAAAVVALPSMVLVALTGSVWRGRNDG